MRVLRLWMALRPQFQHFSVFAGEIWDFDFETSVSTFSCVCRRVLRLSLTLRPQFQHFLVFAGRVLRLWLWDLSFNIFLCLQEEFEAAFRTEDRNATFNYLKSFRRARVNFTSTEATVAARLKFHETELCGQVIKCYFAQVCEIICSIFMHCYGL